MAVNPWAAQPAAMTWGDGYDFLRRARQQQQAQATTTAPDAVYDPWQTGGGDTFNFLRRTPQADTTEQIANPNNPWATTPDQIKNPANTTKPSGATGNPANVISAVNQGNAAAQQQAAAAAAQKNAQTNGTNKARTGTAGRTGATYATFLAANPNFDPWTNGDAYWGAGGGNDPIIAQAFGWTNQWARDNGYNDGSQIPLAQKQQIFFANLERARQQWADNANNPTARQGVTWETSAASKIPNEGWYYEAGSGLTGKPVTQAPGGTTTTATTGTGQGTGDGQTGGTTVATSPDMTGGGAGGAGGAGGTGTGANGSYDLQLQTDKARRMAALFQALGLGSGQQQRSWAGSNLMNIAQSLFDPWSQTQGLDGSSPTTMDMIGQFAQYMGAGGGGAGSIRSDASNAISRLAGGAGALGGLGDRELLPLLQTMSGLAHTGQNKIMQTGYGNLADEATGQYMNQLNATDAAGGNSADLSVLKFLQDNPTYRFLVGR